MGEPQHVNGISALEMIMRDVLDGMEEMVNEAAFSASCADFEILSIEPPEDDSHLTAPVRPRRQAGERPYLAYSEPQRNVA